MSETEAPAGESSPQSTRARLVRAMIDVVGSDGLAAASVRTIARRAGCNEAVLYQHFPSKLAMQQAIYEEIVREMAEAKRIAAGQASSPKELIERWVAETYGFYDHNPAAFAYVYLSFPQLPLSDPAIATENSRAFFAALKDLDPAMAACVLKHPHIVAMAKGVLLSVPREIHEGALDGPAVDHTAAAAAVILKILNEAAD